MFSKITANAVIIYPQCRTGTSTEAMRRCSRGKDTKKFGKKCFLMRKTKKYPNKNLED